MDRKNNPIKRLLDRLGPGLITGASDDDPSGIGTYSQAGAALGYATLWTAVVTLPLMIVVQHICAKTAWFRVADWPGFCIGITRKNCSIR